MQFLWDVQGRLRKFGQFIFNYQILSTNRALKFRVQYKIIFFSFFKPYKFYQSLSSMTTICKAKSCYILKLIIIIIILKLN